MSICVRPDDFPGTCYFPCDFDLIACLSLICNLPSIGNSRVLRHKSLFCPEPCYYSFKSIIDRLYAVFRGESQQGKIWLNISSFSWSQLDSS